MKLIILAAVVLAVLWLARSVSRRASREPADKPPASSAREDMVACRQCGVHLPRSEALPGRGGLFCSEPHRAAYERSDPPAR